MNKKPIVTVAIVAICLAAFALQALSSYLYGRDILIDLFAKNNAYILKGELWRFVTANFLHGNSLHLFLNLPALWIIGRMLEREMDRVRFIALCVGSGLCSTIASFLFAPEMMIGSSGIVFGLWGAMILAIFRSNWKSKQRVLIINISLLIGSLALGFFLPFDTYAHLGGLAFGVVFEALFCNADVFQSPHASLPIRSSARPLNN